MTTTQKTITPDLAAKMLEADAQARAKSKDSRHRNVSGYTVSNFASDIANGKWKLTHQGILVADTGEIIDGRHRLHAILIADKPVKTLLTNGLTEAEAREMMMYLDGGRPRGIASQIWIAEGIEDSRFVVAGIRSQWGLAVGSSKEQGGSSSSVAACYEVQRDTLRQIINILNDPGLGSGKIHRTASSVIGPVAYYAYAHPRNAAEFASSYATGERLAAGSPVLWLKRTFDSMASKRQRHRVHERALITCNALLAFHEEKKCSAVFRPSPDGREWLVKEASGLTATLIKYAPKFVRRQDRQIFMGER